MMGGSGEEVSDVEEGGGGAGGCCCGWGVAGVVLVAEAEEDLFGWAGWCWEGGGGEDWCGLLWGNGRGEGCCSEEEDGELHC